MHTGRNGIRLRVACELGRRDCDKGKRRLGVTRYKITRISFTIISTSTPNVECVSPISISAATQTKTSADRNKKALLESESTIRHC